MRTFLYIKGIQANADYNGILKSLLHSNAWRPLLVALDRRIYRMQEAQGPAPVVKSIMLIMASYSHPAKPLAGDDMAKLDNILTTVLSTTKAHAQYADANAAFIQFLESEKNVAEEACRSLTLLLVEDMKSMLSDKECKRNHADLQEAMQSRVKRSLDIADRVQRAFGSYVSPGFRDVVDTLKYLSRTLLDLCYIQSRIGEIGRASRSEKSVEAMVRAYDDIATRRLQMRASLGSVCEDTFSEFKKKYDVSAAARVKYAELLPRWRQMVTAYLLFGLGHIDNQGLEPKKKFNEFHRQVSQLAAYSGLPHDNKINLDMGHSLCVLCQHKDVFNSVADLVSRCDHSQWHAYFDERTTKLQQVFGAINAFVDQASNDFEPRFAWILDSEQSGAMTVGDLVHFTEDKVNAAVQCRDAYVSCCHDAIRSPFAQVQELLSTMSMDVDNSHIQKLKVAKDAFAGVINHLKMYVGEFGFVNPTWLQDIVEPAIRKVDDQVSLWGVTKLVSSPAAKSVDNGKDIRKGIKAILDAFDRYEEVADDDLKALVNEVLTVHGDVGGDSDAIAPPAQKRRKTGKSPDDTTDVKRSVADV